MKLMQQQLEFYEKVHAGNGQTCEQQRKEQVQQPKPTLQELMKTREVRIMDKKTRVNQFGQKTSEVAQFSI